MAVSSLDSIGSIATHIAESFVLPTGVSGNLIETVNMALVDVQNFTGQTIGSTAIELQYQSPIVNFSKAQALDESFSWAATVSTSGGAVIINSGTEADDLELGDLTIKEAADAETKAMQHINSLAKGAPVMFRKMAMTSLESIGRKSRFARSIS